MQPRWPSSALRLVALLLAFAPAARPAAARTLDAGGGAVELDDRNGSILRAGPANSSACVWRSGEYGLWSLAFSNGNRLAASAFAPDRADRRFEVVGDSTGPVAHLLYRAPEVTVDIAVRAAPAGLDLTAAIACSSGTVTSITLPGRLRFEAAQVRRFVTPMPPHLGVGMALNREFYLPQPPDRPAGWTQESVGDAPARRILNARFDMRDLAAPPIALAPTADGFRLLGTNLARRIASTRARVNRAYLKPQADLVLVDSAQGPLLAACRLGGPGALWRFGGNFDESAEPLAGDAVAAILRKPAAESGTRTNLALLDLVNGPARGSFANMSVAAWRTRLARAAEGTRLRFVSLRSVADLLDATRRPDFAAIVNPYGEGLPAAGPSTIEDAADAIAAYVRAGGQWFETGGYSFHSRMRPVVRTVRESDYPPAFADILHLDAEAGSASVYRVQPRAWAPWAGATDRGAIFVPGRLGTGSDERGGWCERTFTTWVPAGASWTSPVARMTLGRDAADSLRDYAAANALSRPLREKLPPARFDFFRRAVLLKLDGSAREKTAMLDRLPDGTLIHFAEYLKGGFDKEYPDHLPPNAGHGTAAELREFLLAARARGHWTMPYTNPTWWCDHPRGPTFVREGEAPLLRTASGATVYEKYNANDGWTTCLWHPAVRAANRVTLRQFSEEFPVDILFQDQCGARGSPLDFNAASPAPWAYAEGMFSMVAEDARTLPLSTEDGNDRVLASEIQLCGFTFALGPDRHRPEWVRDLKMQHHPATWSLFPVVQILAHDKAALAHHDLGRFVTDPALLTWTLGLGFCMSDRISTRALDETRPREWLHWLDRIQKSVCARYVGEPLASFDHQQGSLESGADGFLRAAYGPVRIAANLDPAPRPADGRTLAGHGFRATAPGLAAGHLRELGGRDFGETGTMYVAEGDGRRADVWFLAPPGTEVAAELPGGMKGDAGILFDGESVAPCSIIEDAIRVRTPAQHTRPAPASDAAVPRLWHAVVTAP